jgi:hypothetical protein
MKRNDKNRQVVLLEIKAEALLLKNNMSSHLLGEALYVQTAYDRLVDQFSDDYPQWCSDEDYDAAKRDFDAFIRLLDAAIADGDHE